MSSVSGDNKKSNNNVANNVISVIQFFLVLVVVLIIPQLVSDNIYYKNVRADVLNSKCSQPQSTEDFLVPYDFNCAMKIRYVVNGEEYIKSFVLEHSVVDYTNKQKINIYVSKNDPNEFNIQYMNFNINYGINLAFLILIIYGLNNLKRN
jgi:hypothetical protein